MKKLLSSGFSRLLHSKIFWLGMLVEAGLAVWACIARYYDSVLLPGMGYDNPDYLLFIAAMYSPVLVAVFVSLFIGTEYSDGTMRNKVAVGHTRLDIYLSNLIVCVAAVLMMHLAYIGVVLALGLPLLGGFVELSAKTLVVFFFCSLATEVALAALMLVGAMLIPNKAVSAIVTMLLGLGLLMAAMTIQSRLNAPEMISNWIGLSEAGELMMGEPYPNPKYLTGAKRQLFQFLYELLPGGQLITIGQSVTLPESVWHLPVYSLLLTVLTTLGGALAFRQRDLK